MPGSSKKGGRKPKVEDRDIIQLFQDTPDPVLSTSEVAEQIPIQRRGTLNRLQSLEDRDVLESKTIGGRNTIWWVTPSAAARKPSDSERGAGVASGSDAKKSKSKPLRKSDSNLRPENGPYSDLSFPGSKDRQECITAINAVVEYLKKNGPASMREIVQDVMPEFPLGYDVPELEEGERYRGSWWRKVIKPGLEVNPNIKKPSGGGKWQANE